MRGYDLNFEIPTWEEIKQGGSVHYKNNEAQMIDIYKSRGTLRPWVVNEICQHAIRNDGAKNISNKDMRKIIHYAMMLMSAYGDGE